ncbi:hypothetical protein EVG20_g4423 [Dentipellis fragilis]|uniref:Uncharacterized protein n=1 Tax=Dentipellis fragilis TaxID=205917 RepID=A0A4Y9YYC0_9AGAM|nr:hypothetical protein EVG20_g4423 [Dentipellis fragilis]
MSTSFEDTAHGGLQSTTESRPIVPSSRLPAKSPISGTDVDNIRGPAILCVSRAVACAPEVWASTDDSAERGIVESGGLGTENCG